MCGGGLYARVTAVGSGLDVIYVVYPMYVYFTLLTTNHYPFQAGISSTRHT